MSSKSKPTRDFLFIDESGDPGKADLKDSSDFYMVMILHVTDISLRELTDHFCRLRYFKTFNKELKNIYKDKDLLEKLLDIYKWISNKENVFCSSVYLQKEDYKGPYLSEDSYGGYDPQKFRNFILSKALERHFYLIEVLSNELEIVIDRFYSKKEKEEELFKYLQGNNKLPNILNLEQVDSRYVEGVQLVDLLGNILRAKIIDGWSDLDNEELDFCEKTCLNFIPKKYPQKIHNP